MIEKIEKLKRQIIDIERKIEKSDDIKETLRLKKEKIKLESELIEITEKEIGEDSSEGIMSLAEAIELYEAMPKQPLYQSGIEPIDRHLDGGFAMSQLVVVAGEKGAGKTMLLMQILRNVSQGFGTLLFSLEMPYWKIVERFRRYPLDEKVLKNLNIADKKFTLEAMESIIKIKAKDGVKFFAIDSLMKIQTLKNFTKPHEKYSHISATLSRIAIENDVIIFLIAQMSKQDIQNNNLALKNSGDVEYDADLIFFLLKDKNIDNKRVLVCDKNRQTGEEFKETLYVDKNRLELSTVSPVEVVYDTTAVETL